MGLVSPVRPVEYKGDGTTKRFSFPFPYDNKNDVVVELCTYGTNNWIVQSEGGSYRFVNDNTIEFKFAPKNVGGGDEQNAIKISRKTYARTVIANKFAESRPECAVVIKDCRGEYDGTDGAFTDDRDEPLRPFKVGDTITYTSPCDDGAYIYWYSKPREGLTGDHILIRTDQLEGRNDEDKTTSLTLVDSHLDKRIYVKVQCIGCGPPDGLCCEWTVETDNDVLDSNGCGLNAVVGSTSKKMLHNVGYGRGVVRVDFNSPEISRVFNITFPDGTSYDYTVGGTSNPAAHFIVSKSDESAYLIITVPNASDKGWEYSLRCTEAVDTSKYKFCRWIGDVKSFYGETDIYQAHDTTAQNQATWRFPRVSSWLEYNPGSKTDGYATINGPGISEFSSWSVGVYLYGPYYFDDEPWNDVYNYQVKPWRSSYTLLGHHNGLGITFGSLSVNTKGCPNCAPAPTYTNSTYVRYHSRAIDSWFTVAGYWEFSNDESDPDNKVVEASWDGYRGDAYQLGIGGPNLEKTVGGSYMPNLTGIN